MNYRFNDEIVTVERMGRVMSVDGVNEHTLSYEACDNICEILCVEGMTDVEEVRAVRNSVVRYLSNRIEKECMTEEGEWKPYSEVGELFRNLQMWTSAITCAIDRKMRELSPKEF